MRDAIESQKSKMAAHKNQVYSFSSLYWTYHLNYNNYTYVLIFIFILIFRWNDITSNLNNHTKYVLESNRS